jgi:hypothetical protein
MADEGSYWTTVGSTGTLSAADLAKVSLNNAVISLGTGIAPPPATAAEDPSIVTREISAVVRYNITPVDGLFATGLFAYVLQLTARGAVGARLVQFDLSSGTETDLVQFAPGFPSPPGGGFTTIGDETAPTSTVMDFVNCAYYVEATLTASATVVGNPAEIAAVKVFATTNF